MLPRVFESPQTTGSVSQRAAELTGLRVGTPVVAGAGDQAGGAVGIGIVQPGAVSATIGTSGVVFAATNSPALDPKGRVHTFCHAVPGRWHVMGVTQGAGLSMRWFRDQFGSGEGEGDPYDRMTAEAEQIEPGSNGLLWTPYLMGERTPHLDPHGLLITRLNMQPFIVTLCGLLFYRGLARFITKDETKGFGTVAGMDFLRYVANGNLFGIPMPFVLLILISIITWVVLHRSVYGRYLFATGRNAEAARYAGINTKGIVTAAYVISGALTAISGIIIAFYTNSVSPANHGNAYELYGIAAAVLGGCSLRGGEGSVVGILIGTALLQVLRNLVNLLGIPSSLDFAVMGAVILIGVMADQILTERRNRRQVAMMRESTKSEVPATE